jgi:HSP20 family molecular chaperone IbpA
MAVMRSAGDGRRLLPHAHVREDRDAYVVTLDVSDFTESELAVEALGPTLTVRGAQEDIPDEVSTPFRVRERLEESFRLPDDARLDRIAVYYKHGTLEIHAPRVPLERRRLEIERQTFAFAFRSSAGV